MFIALLVIAILVLLIVVHEFGHFVAAKIFGVKVEEFGVGYPPRAFTFGKFGETEYTLNWIPFGGFVRLFGDTGEAQHGRGSLVDSARSKQAVILVAGVAANAIAAWALLALALHIGVPQVVDSSYLPVSGTPVLLIVSAVVAGSPADAAGIKAGDEILGVEGSSGEEVGALTPESVADFVKARGGKPITLVYIHEGATSTATIIPANAVIPNAAGQPALGVALVRVADVSHPWGEAMSEALGQTQRAFVVVAADLSVLVRDALRGTANFSDVIGPIGIVGYVSEASQHGLGAVLRFAALISVNLAIINLIPIPALDGGRLLILGVEAIRRRDAPRLVLQLLNALGIALIIALMFVVTYQDITRLLA